MQLKIKNVYNYKRNKFPLYIQSNKYDCGIACLKMLTKYYKKDFPNTINSIVKFDIIRGISLLDMKIIAKNIGFLTYSLKISLKQLFDYKPIPCIIHWAGKHFIILYKISSKSVFIADPLCGYVSFPVDIFKRKWKKYCKNGIILFLKPIKNG